MKPAWGRAAAAMLIACGGRERAATPATAASTSGVSSAVAVVASAASITIAPAEKALVVHLVPLGGVSDETLADTAAAFKAHAPHVAPVIEARQTLPKYAESTDKGRYRAEKLLDALAAMPIDDAPEDKIMGVTDIDIVTDKNGNPNWGILGLGALDGRCSVISTYRMKRKWEPGGGAPESLVHARLWKIALHELGHTLGLDHCPTTGCLMEDAHGTVKTVDVEEELCPVCAKKFSDAVEEGAMNPIVE